MTGLYLARGWALWFLRYRRQKAAICATWGVLFIILLQMSYQLGAGPAETIASAKIASKHSIVTTILSEVSASVEASAPPAPVPAPVPVAPPAPVVQTFVYARKVGNSYAYGNCTFYVANRRDIPSNWGNARSWLYNAQRAGFATGNIPKVGAIAWTGGGYLGHVAMVEEVAGGQVKIAEMNGMAGFNRVGFRWVAASAFKYIY